MLKDEEYEQIGGRKEGEEAITTVNKQVVVNDNNYKGFDEQWQQAIKESIVWFKQAKKDDKRTDKLASVILSRLYPKLKDYQWHIITGKVS
jgi:hypothetical protein